MAADQTPREADVTTQEETTNITPFLLASIGALLMLMFGGVLFSSGAPLCKTKTFSDSKYKRKFEQQYGRRKIRFHNVPEKIALEPCPVLQQENNDIVDAVKKEYQDLPQYQPVSSIVSNIVGLHGHTCAVSSPKPEVIERGASPTHLTGNEGTLESERPLSRDKRTFIILEHDDKPKCKILSATLHDKSSIMKDNNRQRAPSASSGIGTNSQETFEIDSLEEFPLSENGSKLLDETVILDSNDKVFPSDSTPKTILPNIDRGVYSGGRLSVLQLERAPSCLCVKGCNCTIHGTYTVKTEMLQGSKGMTDERLTWGDIALSINSTTAHESQSYRDLSVCADTLKPQTPPADVSWKITTRNAAERSPLRRADLEKWLYDVEESRRECDQSCTQTLFESLDAETEIHRKDFSFPETTKPISGQRKMSAPLQESLKLLKRLQVICEEDLQVAQSESLVHRGGRESCLKIVRAPSSLCVCGGNCKARCQIEVIADQSSAPSILLGDDTIRDDASDILNTEQELASTRTERIARGGTETNFKCIRASSEICIHGPSCQFHCQKMKEEAENTRKREMMGRKHQELGCHNTNSEIEEFRGASSFGKEQYSYKYRIMLHQGSEPGAFSDDSLRKEERRVNIIRGASSFGGSGMTSTQYLSPGDESVRGASSFALKPANDNEMKLDELRGASSFAPLDESIAGTSSVTLSLAVESEGESFVSDKSLNNSKGDSTFNPRSCVDKLGDTTPVAKDEVKQGFQTNSSRSTESCKEECRLDHNNNSRVKYLSEKEPRGGKTECRELDDRVVITRNKKEDEQRKTSHKPTLKVGKDLTMMSTLLHALQKSGEQRNTETATHDRRTSQRVNKEKTTETNCNAGSAGNLKFAVFYKGANSSTPLLYVSVLGLQEVPDTIITNQHRAYVRLCLFPKFTTWRRTKTHNVSEKVLIIKDHFIISDVKPSDLEEAILRFEVVCVNKEERIIGQVEIPLVELKSRDKLKRTAALQSPKV